MAHRRLKRRFVALSSHASDDAPANNGSCTIVEEHGLVVTLLCQKIIQSVEKLAMARPMTFNPANERTLSGGFGYDTAATVRIEVLFTVHRHHENLDLRLFRSVVIFDCGPKDRNEDTGFLLANTNERIVIVHASLLLTSPLELRLSEAAAPSLPCGLDV